MAPFSVHPDSFNPPALSAADDAAAEAGLPWVLVELQAYVAKRENATTAYSKTWNGKNIQVTFCLRRPPLLSCLCVHSDDAEIPIEPKVLSTEGGLALLRITIGREEDVLKEIDYYVYQADDGTGKPSLKHLKRPPKNFSAANIGILPYRTNQGEGDDQTFMLRRCSLINQYIVAGFRHSEFDEPSYHFVLCLYDSKLEDWKTYKVTLNQQQVQQCGGDDFYHKNCKVMAMGDGATMGFVDLWQGILLCNLHEVSDKANLQVKKGEALPVLRYVAVPPPLQKNKSLKGDANLYRNIAVVNNRLKYVELQLHWKASVVFRGFLTDGWMAAVFSRPLSCLDSDSWHLDCKMDSKDLNARDNPQLRLLPKVINDEGMRLPPFKRLDVCQPVLGLQDDANILYFTTKINRSDYDAWVTAVDMGTKKLLGVAAFAGARTVGINFAYVHSKISTYLGQNVGEDTIVDGDHHHQDIEDMEVDVQVRGGRFRISGVVSDDDEELMVDNINRQG